MKKVYKLNNHYFNIEHIKSMSELFEIEETTSTPFAKISYLEGCKHAMIYIDDKEYSIHNCEYCVGYIKPTETRQKQYDNFCNEARELLTAFKEM